MENFFENFTKAAKNGVREVQNAADQAVRTIGKPSKMPVDSNSQYNRTGTRYTTPDEGELTIDIASNNRQLNRVLDMYENAPNMDAKIDVLKQTRKYFDDTPGIDMWFNNLINVTDEMRSGKGKLAFTKDNLPGVIYGHRQWIDAAYDKYFGRH